LECTAFTNSDGSTAVVVMNRSLTAMPFELRIDDMHCITELPARAIATYWTGDFA
jgi:glucosylceramidase